MGALVKRNAGQLVVWILLLAGLVAAGPLIASGSLSSLDMFRDGLVLVIALAALVVLALGKQGTEIGFYLWIGTFALGYRTIHVTDNLSIHPSEVLIWGLFLMVVIENIRTAKPNSWPLPISLTILLAVGIVGVLTALNNKLALDSILNEYKDFWVAIPIFGVVSELLRDEERRDRAVAVFVIVQFYVAFAGAVEYRFPGIASRFSPYYSTNAPIVTPEGFYRAVFSFWGGPIAATTLTVALPLILYLWGRWKTRPRRLLLAGMMLVILYGIYIVGFRHLWVTVALMLVFYFVSRRSFGGAVTVVLALAAVSWLAPADFTARLQSLANIGTANADSSAVERIDYLQYALQRIQANPVFGSGWSASGWVHNDYLQIAGNLGILAGLLFLIALVWAIFKLGIVTQTPSNRATRTLANALLVALVGYMVTLATGDIINLMQTIVPFWFILALSYVMIDHRVPVAASTRMLWARAVQAAGGERS